MKGNRGLNEEKATGFWRGIGRNALLVPFKTLFWWEKSGFLSAVLVMTMAKLLVLST